MNQPKRSSLTLFHPQFTPRQIPDVLEHASTAPQEIRIPVHQADQILIVNTELEIAHQLIPLRLPDEVRLRRLRRPRVERTEPLAQRGAEGRGPGAVESGSDPRISEKGFKIDCPRQVLHDLGEGGAVEGQETGCLDGDGAGRGRRGRGGGWEIAQRFEDRCFDDLSSPLFLS